MNPTLPRTAPANRLRHRLHTRTRVTPDAPEPLEPRIAPATAYVWNGSVSDDWFVAQNWSPNGVPGANDSATLDIPSTINLTSPATVIDFTQTDGTLTGSSILSISSTFVWSGGAETGAGSTLLQPGSALEISGPATKTLTDRTLNLFGNTTWTGAGNIVFNSGLLRNQPSGFFDIQTDADLVDADGPGTAAAFISDGILYKTAGIFGSDTTEFSGVALTLRGPTAVAAGELRIAGGASAGNASFDILPGAQLTIASNFSLGSGGQFANSGTVLIGSGGTLDADASLTLDGAFELRTGGTLASDGDISINGTVNWFGGTILSLNDKTTITATGTLNVSGAATRMLFSSLVNEGTFLVESASLTFASGFTQEGGTTILSAGHLTKSGTLVFHGGTLLGTGTIDAHISSNGTTIQPGGPDAAGLLSITGDCTLFATTLEIEIGGTVPGTQFDQLAVGGTATLAGTLKAKLLNGFSLGASQSFAVLPYTNHGGFFGTINLPPDLTASALATAYTLTSTVVPPSNVVTTALDVVNANDNVVSFREAILYANSHPGLDTILFAIPGAGVHTLNVATALPAITDTVIIDGYSQSGASANTLADGNNAVLQIGLHNSGAARIGLEINADSVTVRGLAITGFVDDAVVVHANGAHAVIAGNFIGLDAAGLGAGNGEGILIDGAHKMTVGGLAPGDRNVISRNSGSGLVISGSTGTDNNVQGNFIGTNITGSTSNGFANGGSGVVVVDGASYNLIGGPAIGARNVISGHGAQNGVVIDGAGTDSNLVQGNYIGTNATGTAGLANFFGVVVSNGAQGNIIGGTAAGAGNLISGNSVAGVLITGAGTANNLVQGNTIGTDATRTLSLGNGTGVFLANTGGGNTVGGTAAGAGNLIAFNQTGILVDTASRGELLLGNSVQANIGAQIDLGGDGATPNDGGAPPDTDTGANDLQNFPVISALTLLGPLLVSSGTIASTPNTTFRIEFYAQSAVGAGGELLPTYLGFITETTDALGHAVFDSVGILTSGVHLGDQVVATATDVTGAGTSELSAPLIVVSTPRPVISVADAILLEGNTGTTALVFTLTLDRAQPDAPVTVNFATSDFTAHAGSDYTAQSGIVTFAPGQTQQTVAIDITGDTLAESRERFHLTLSDPTYATLGDSAAIGIIQDDDHHFIAAGSGHGGTLSIFQTTPVDATLVTSLKPFGTAFKGGVRVAVGDVNGDGTDDFVAAAGSGTNGRVRVFDGTTLLPFADPSHAAFADLAAFPGYRGGVFVAVGDVNGDGFGDLIVSTGTGRTNMVKVFSGADATLFTSFQAFGGNTGGVRVATGDVNGDGYADLVTGSGKGSAVRVFDIHDPATSPATLQSFDRIFAKSYRGGVHVATGDLSDATHLGAFDGTDDLIVSAGAGRANVRIVPGLSTAPEQTILAYARPFHGVRVATADVNGDGIADLIAAQGTAGRARVSVLSGLDFNQLFDFALQPKSNDGVYVG